MNKRILEVLLASKCDYYIVETYEEYHSSETRYLAMIALEEQTKKLLRERDLTTITFTEVESLDSYFGNSPCNIILNSNTPPFQLGLNFLRIATDIIPLTEGLPYSLMKDLKYLNNVNLYKRI